MTTSEPPEHRPTPPDGSNHPAPDHSAPEHPAGSESPTGQIDSSGTAAPVVEHGTESGTEHGSTRTVGASRWNPRGWSPRRRWVGIGVLVILVLLIAALICGISRHHRFGFGHRHGHHGGHGHSAFQQGMPGGGMGMGGFGDQMGGPGGDQMGGPGGDQMGGPGGDQMGGPGGWRGRQGGPMAGTTMLSGAVVSVAPGNLVVAQDGAGQVTVPTTDRTRVMGAGNGLTGLQPGQRVVVRIGGDKSAVAVFSPKAQAMGTITAITGDRATLVRQDGLTEPVDLSAVNPKPANGDVVAVSGTAAENGATLKVDTLQTLPKAG